jgi:excisionase family DNA binding protein
MSNTQQQERRALSIKETAQASGLSRASLYRLIEQKKLTTVKIGARRLVPVGAIDVLMREGACAMSPNSKNPVPLAAGRAPNRFCLAAESDSDDSQATRRFQALFVARRFHITPAVERSRLHGSAAMSASQTALDVRTALLRDFIFEALAPVENDTSAARACLRNDDDAGTRYHLKRVVECVKASASTFRELESLTGTDA